MTRTHIPDSVKREAAVQQTGLCPCGLVLTGNCELDHIVPLGLGGDNDLDNLCWRHRACHTYKTRADIAAIAKAERIRRKRDGSWKKKGPKLQSRGFDSRFRKRLDGKVERR